jgi:hypothetical protein
MEDPFEFLIKSSLETPVDLCNTAFSGIDFVDGTEMVVPRTFDVNEANEPKAIYIPTEVSGLDALGSCKKLLHLTLDYETSKPGLYKTAWSERGDHEISEETPVWVEEIDGFKHLMMNITHEQYVYGMQMMYNSIDPSITTKFRFSYRNSFDDVIISNAFDMTVSNPKVTEEQECLDEFVTKEDQISHDLKLAFKGLLADDEDEFAQIEIPSPVNTKWHDDTLGCRLHFKLQAFESGANDFVDWDDFVNTIKDEVPNKVLYSDISFSSESGYFNA